MKQKSFMHFFLGYRLLMVSHLGFYIKMIYKLKLADIKKNINDS